jgi:hypothetical protein
MEGSHTPLCELQVLRQTTYSSVPLKIFVELTYQTALRKACWNATRHITDVGLNRIKN